MMRYVAMLLGLATVFAVTAAGAQTVLKSGDTLSISVLQDSTIDRTVVIDPSGEIALPLAGHISAKGLTTEALEQIVGDKLKANYKVDHLDVTIALVRSADEEDLKPRVYVTGGVAKPGAYVARQPLTLMQAIALAGGLGQFAAEGRIQVHRSTDSGEERIFMFDYKAYQAGRNTSANIPLQAGDIVVIPERGIFE